MIPRLLDSIAFDPKFGRQMRFIAGPRQSGKTTLAKIQLHKKNSDQLYYNWDQRKIRKLYRESPYFFVADAPKCWAKFLLTSSSKNLMFVGFYHPIST